MCCLKWRFWGWGCPASKRTDRCFTLSAFSEILEAVTKVEIKGSLPKDKRCSIKVSELNSVLKRKNLFCQENRGALIARTNLGPGAWLCLHGQHCRATGAPGEGWPWLMSLRERRTGHWTQQGGSARLGRDTNVPKSLDGAFGRALSYCQLENWPGLGGARFVLEKPYGKFFPRLNKLHSWADPREGLKDSLAEENTPGTGKQVPNAAPVRKSWCVLSHSYTKCWAMCQSWGLNL